MFSVYASNSHSYTHSKVALGIVSTREPTVWGFITSQYPGIHDIGQATSVNVNTEHLQNVRIM